jgi:hypothetical protein
MIGGQRHVDAQPLMGRVGAAMLGKAGRAVEVEDSGDLGLVGAAGWIE